jgi:hypothetical protein
VKNDRRWFVPGVTEAKRDPAYWVDLNAWLVDGGLEIVHQWAYDYVAEHGAVGPGDDAPVSDAKNRLVQSSRSEGQQLVFDLGEAAMRRDSAEVPTEVTTERDKAVVLTDRNVRAWLAVQRQMSTNDPRLESMLTVRTQLRAAGMAEVAQRKITGFRHVALANKKAVEEMAKTPIEQTSRTTYEQAVWNGFMAFKKEPRNVVEADNATQSDPNDAPF